MISKNYIKVLIVLSISIMACTQADHPSMSQAQIQQEMILIPGGEFMMGKDGDSDYAPAHKVFIDSFYIDKYEVTNAMYYEYCQATEADLPEFWDMEEFHSGTAYPDHPVVGIGWAEAKKYAEWAGKRLPTEAEWEYAARGGLIDTKFAHGDSVDPAFANFAFEGKRIGTQPVGSYPANGYGLHDMTGNVREWVYDYYDKNYYQDSPYENPQGPEKGPYRVVRDGGWHSGPSCCRVFTRIALSTPYWRDFAIGFRCAKDIESEEDTETE